jgi:integrase
LIHKHIKNNSLSAESFLFATRQSDSISTKRIRQIIQKTSKENIGFEISPKDLREYSIKQKLKIKDFGSVKKDAGLKRIDKRKYLSSDEVKRLEKTINSKRDYLIFKLLLNNFKSSGIVNFKVEDVLDSSIPESLANELESYAISKGISFGEYLFSTRQKTHLTNERIFQIISSLGKKIGIEASPRILNNTAIVNAVSSKNPKSKLNALGVKTRVSDIRRGILKNE